MQTDTETRIVNLTSHPVRLQLDDGSVLDFPPSGQIARLQMDRSYAGSITVQGRTIPIYRASYGHPTGMPPSPEPNTYYIVSLLTALALTNDPTWHGHLLVPDTGPGSAIRDESGNIAAVRQFLIF